MKSILGLILLSLSISSAQASDHWDRCENKQENVVLEDGIFLVGGDDITAIAGPEIVKSKKISSKTEYCILKKSGKRVIAFSEVVSKETIRWGWKMNTNYTVVICHRGGSGIPASDSCK